MTGSTWKPPGPPRCRWPTTMAPTRWRCPSTPSCSFWPWPRSWSGSTTTWWPASGASGTSRPRASTRCRARPWASWASATSARRWPGARRPSTCTCSTTTSLRLTEDQEDALGVRFVLFEELLRTSDIVTLHVPLSDRTRGMLGARQFALMKPTAIFINTCRGPVVDEDALLQGPHHQADPGRRPRRDGGGAPGAESPALQARQRHHHPAHRRTDLGELDAVGRGHEDAPPNQTGRTVGGAVRGSRT